MGGILALCIHLAKWPEYDKTKPLIFLTLFSTAYFYCGFHKRGGGIHPPPLWSVRAQFFFTQPIIQLYNPQSHDPLKGNLEKGVNRVNFLAVSIK